MTKKFIIEQAWLLDENGKRVMKLILLDINTIPRTVNEEDIRGGYGNIKK